MTSRLTGPSGTFHEYTLDGKRVPSVTSIINKTVAKEALAPAAAKVTAAWCATHAGELGTVLSEPEWVELAKGHYQRVWNRSRDDGIQVHSIAQGLVYGEPVETHDPDTGELYSDDVVRMGAQVARFLDAWGVDPDTALVENGVFHEQLRIAGRFDLCAVLRDGQRYMVDYKSGASGVWPESALQLTAYSRMTHVRVGEGDDAVDHPLPRVDRCAVLWVRPDRWELVPVKSDDAQWQAFVHAIEVAAWAQQSRRQLIGDPLPVPAAAS